MANYDARINITANASQAERELQRLQGRLEQVERAANLDIGAAIRLGGIQRSIATVNQLDRAVSSLRSTVRTINSPGGGNLGDAFRTAAAAANQFFDSLSTGERFLSNSIAGLKEQANAFATLAGNISSAEARFVDYVQGAQSAQDKGLRPLFRQFEALRALYEEGVTGRGVEINTKEMGAGLFEQLSREVPQTEAALKAFSTELQRVRSLIGSESIAAFGIEQQIIEIEQQLLTIEQNRLETRAALNRELSAPVQSSLARMEGRTADPFGISGEQINEALNTRAAEYVKQQDELASLKRTLSSMESARYDPLGISDSQINQGLEERARNYAQQTREIANLRQALGGMESRQVNWATAFGISESDIAAERARELEVEWNRLNEAAKQLAAQAPQAAAALQAFKFETLAKDADAYTRALLNQQRTLDEYADSANRAAAASAELGYGGELPALRPAGFTNQDVRIKNLLDDQTAAARIVADLEMDLDKMVNQFEIENIERELKAELDRIDTILDARTRAGEKWWAGEKKRLDEKTKLEQEQERQSRLPFLERRFGARRSRAISEGLVGGAFPLLFGQGIGAAALGGLGGAAGGFAGGGLGFGLSLVGTALGTAFDEAVQGAKELGDALQKPVENFDQLAEKSFFSSKALEDTIKKTIEYGDTATASALIQEEAIKRLGVGGVQNLKTLGTESDRLNRAFAELGQQMQAVAAGPLASITGFFANIFGQAAAAGRVRLLRANLSQEQAGQFNQEVRQRLQQQGIQRGFFAPSAPTDAEIGMLQDRGALQDIVDKWQAIEIQGKIKLDPKQRIESEINALQKKLEVLDIGKSLKDQFRSAAREQEDLDKQRADLVRSYEESIGDIRKKVEDEIRNKRFATLEKENQLLDLQGQIRLKQLQIVNQAAVAQAGVGERPEFEQAAKEIAQIVAQFTEQQLSAEEEAASIKRNAALDVQKIDSGAAQFKANIEREVSRLNIETARRVADINEQVRRRNEDFDLNRFKLEKAIAELQLKNNEIITEQQLDTARKNLETAKKAGDAQGAAYAQSFVSVYQSQLDIIKKGQQDISAISAPARLRGVGQVGGGSVSTAGLDRATADYRAAVENYVAAQLRLNELEVVKNAQDFAIRIAEFANKTDAVLTAIQTRESDAEIERLRYIELINAGLTDTVAQKVIELETTKRVALAVYDTAIAQLENKIVAGEVTAQVDAQNRAYLKQIKILKQRKDALEGKFGEVDTATGQGTGAIGQAIESDRGKKIQEFISTAQEGLNDLESYAIRVSQGIGDAVGNSLSNGVAGLIEGTATAKEVFAGFLKDVGQILASEGAKMIATYIAIGIAKIFAGLAAGASSGSSSTAIPSTGTPAAPTVNGFDTGSIANIAANGAYFDGGMAYFANGGIVSSPTLFQFADGGVTQTGVMGEAGPEAIMPLERGPDGKLGVSAKLSGAMSRYSRPPGAAGGPEGGSGDSASTGGGAAVATAPIDVRYTVERINSVDYVTADQFRAGMAQAAQQGAKQGEQSTLRRLQQSSSTRRRLGM